MQLPQSILDEAEAHPCLSGCYGERTEIRVSTSSRNPAEPVLVADCKDCHSFYLGVPLSMLPPGATAKQFAAALTEHVEHARGFDLTFGGYHTVGPGFWLSGIYYANLGVFLLDGHRSRSIGTELDLLMAAFQHRVVPLPDPQMLDRAQYIVRDVYLSRSLPLTPVASLADLLSLPQLQLHPPPASQGWKRVTLAAFQPIAAQAAATPSTPTSSSGHALRRPRSNGRRTVRIGEVCPVCNAQVRQRPLLHGTYIGCLC